MHDAKGPIHAMAARGWTFDGLTSDTALAAYLALPGQRSFDLADLAVRYVGRELTSGEKPSASSPWTWRRMTARPRPRTPSPSEPGPPPSWPTLSTPTWNSAARRGCCTRSSCRWSACSRRWSGPGSPRTSTTWPACRPALGGEVKDAEQAAYAVTGHEFNLGSPKQLQEVLFTELGLPKTKRIKTGYTTDSEALTSLLAQTGNPILAHLLRHRDVARLKSIVDSLIPMASVDGRIHTTYNQMIAATGRLSSTDPTCRTSRSGPRRDAASGGPSWSAPDTRPC